MKLLVPRTRTVIGARDFAVSAATSWNSLPAVLRLSSLSVQTFARKLKTFHVSATMQRKWGPFILRFTNAKIIFFSTKRCKNARKSVRGRPRFFGAFVQVSTRGTAQQRKVELVSFAGWRYFIIHVTITTNLDFSNWLASVKNSD